MPENQATHHHNKGEQDGSKGKYDPPHDGLMSALSELSWSDQDIEDRANYRKGYEHGKRQSK